MKLLGVFPLIFIVFLSGCASQEPETTETITQPQYSVEIIDYPQSVKAGEQFTVTWRVNSSVDAIIQHTSVHYGSESFPGEVGLDVAPGGTVYTSLISDYASGSFNIPDTFSGQLTATSIPAIYFRGHAIIGGGNYWTEEYMINVEPALEEGTLQAEVTPPSTPSTKEFSIEADDNGFYIDGQDIPSIPAGNGDVVKITFTVREAGTYFGGLDFRGCGQDTADILPGNSVTVEFTASNTCTIISYWPASNREKESMQVVVS